MESNYIKSARIKLQKLGITDYKEFRSKYSEVMKIIEDTILKEWDRKLKTLPTEIESVYPVPGYSTFVAARSIPELPPEKKPWELQTLEYYTRTPSNFIKDFVKE